MGSGEQRRPSLDLAKLRDAVAQWRKRGGGRGSRIPEELWNEAVRVARVDGVWWTSRVVHFNYQRLKRRIDREGSISSSESTVAGEIAPTASAGHDEPRNRRRPPNAFVELRCAPIDDGSSPLATGTVVEVEDKAGTRMTVRLARETHVDVARWISAFRRRRGHRA